MKIVHINKLYSQIGGIENYLYHLTNRLAIKYKHEVTVLACNNKLKTEINQNNNLKIIKIASFPKIFRMPVSPFFPFYMKKVCDADIVHFHHPFPLAELFSLGMKFKGKVVITWHSDIINQKRLLTYYQPFLHKFLKRADAIIATSQNYIESSSFLKYYKEKCHVIPLGVDFNRFKKYEGLNYNKIKGIKSKFDKPLLLYIGKIRYYKGLEYLVKAMQTIDANLVIIGDGPLKENMKSMVSALYLDHKVHFFPHLPEDELYSYYYACDLFVLPSVEMSEAFGIVQLEAMACGKPVISTNLPTGVPFVNKNGYSGLIVPPQNSQALADAINLLIRDFKLRKQLGNNARIRVNEKFTTSAVAHKTMDLYENINH